MGNTGLPLGTRHSSGFTSTRIISGPIRRTQLQGITKSSLGPNSPKYLPRPGTTMALTDPSGTITRRSVTNPSLHPSRRQTTYLQSSSVNLQPISSPLYDEPMPHKTNLELRMENYLDSKQIPISRAVG